MCGWILAHILPYDIYKHIYQFFYLNIFPFLFVWNDNAYGNFNHSMTKKLTIFLKRLFCNKTSHVSMTMPSSSLLHVQFCYCTEVQPIRSMSFPDTPGKKYGHASKSNDITI